jgi:hypothetical protein
MSNAPKPQPPKVKPVGKVGIIAKPSPKPLGNPVLTIDEAAQIALLMSGITHTK